MRYIERELEKISVAMQGDVADERYCQLYAAQQALVWALDPQSYAAPSVTIKDGKIQPLTDTLEGSTDCSGEVHRSAS